jgi:hypothetical protein
VDKHRTESLRTFGAAGFALLLAVAVALATLSESSRRGRLSTVPTVDNVIYMADGARLLAAFESGGLRGVVREYVRRPPHAPYSAMLAFGAYAVAGVQDAAPQLASIVIPLIGLAWCVRLARGAPPLTVALLLVSVALTPIWVWSIEIFKPDYFAGLMTAIAMTVILQIPAGKGRIARSCLAGAALGLALWAKPTFFPGTMVYCGAALLARWASLRKGSGARGGVPSLLGMAGPAGLTAAAIAGPHYVLALRGELEYIWMQMAGSHAEMWRLHGTAWQHATFYLTGPSGSALLGRWWPFMVGAMVIMAALFCWRFGAASVRRGWPWALCLGLTLLVPTVSRMKVIEFATTFDFLMLFAFVRSLSQLARLRRRLCPRWPGAAVLASLCAMAAAVTFRWTIPLSAASRAEEPRPTAAERAEVATKVFASAARLAGGRKALVLVVGTRGILNHNLFEIWTVRDRVSLSTSMVRRSISDAELATRLAGADVLVANNGATGMTDAEGPDGLSRELLDRIAANPAWEERSSVPVPGTSGRFVIFARR